MRTGLVAGLAALTMLGAPAAHADTADAPSLGQPRYSGSGCPPGSVEAKLASDGQTLSLLYRAFNARQGPGVPLTERRKDCTVELPLHVPAGMRFALHSLDEHGFIELERGVRGTAMSRTWLQGNTPGLGTWHSTAGPVAEDYQHTQVFDPSEQPPSPCGADTTVYLGGTIQLSGADSTKRGHMGGDPATGELSKTLHLIWKTCPKP